MADDIPLLDLRRQYELIRPAVDAGMAQVIANTAFINGPQVAQLEQQLAAYAGVSHCVTCANGTDAMVLALRACGVGPGDEVITSPFTFFATAEAVCLSGATPVFADIRPGSFTIDPDAVAAAVTPRTKAILPVSLFGQLAEMERLQEVADRHGLHLIEDGAQSFGAGRHGRRSGAWGRMGTTSFFPAKPLGCWGDGGAVFTADVALDKELRLYREHGMERRDKYIRIGTTSRLDTLQAAVLLAKLPILDQELQARRRIAAAYDAGLADCCGVPPIIPGNEHVYAVYTIRVPAGERDRIVAGLQANGIPARMYYSATVPEQSALAHLGYRRGSLPEAERAVTEVLSLPMQPYLTDAQVARVIAGVRAIVAKN